MSYKTILVHVDSSRRASANIKVAANLASTFDAHLTGLYISYISELRNYAIEGSFDLIPESVQRDAKLREKEAAALFEQHTKQSDIHNIEWRRGEGFAEETLQLNSHYADLIVVGQTNPEEPIPFVPKDFPALLTLTIPRPILVVPYVGLFNQVGKHILVCWNGTNESARAVSNALPMLERADKVTVLIVNPIKGRTGHGDIPGADVSLYLARHGIKVEAICEDGVITDVADYILSRASDLGVDLMVMGTYGHFRLREQILGGVTKTLMQEMIVPLLLSH